VWGYLAKGVLCLGPGRGREKEERRWEDKRRVEERDWK
jgi:hypothetical protein